ncbi:MAG: LamG domain-containing protein [Candidatus Nealsonbacteria bacterium]|nr:LamG domain-containing protein [Candidatus Nealsonbacteria bacterium]
MLRSLCCMLSVTLMLGMVGNALGQETEVAAKNLVGWWKLDDATGATAADSSKHGHKGSLKDGLTFDKSSVDGRVGKAMKFEKSGCLEITGYKGVTGIAPRTVAAWIKTTERRGDIIRWGADDAGKIFRFGFIRGRVGLDPSGGYLYVNDDLTDDKWHHVAVAVVEDDPPNLHDSVNLYVDGKPAAIHDIGLLDLWPLDTGDKLDVTIGSGFDGLIDEVRLYDRALSAEEIKALFETK